MKVWELIAALSKMPAGKKISIVLPHTNASYALTPTDVVDSDHEEENAAIDIFTKKH